MTSVIASVIAGVDLVRQNSQQAADAPHVSSVELEHGAAAGDLRSGRLPRRATVGAGLIAVGCFIFEAPPSGHAMEAASDAAFNSCVLPPHGLVESALSTEVDTMRWPAEASSWTELRRALASRYNLTESDVTFEFAERAWGESLKTEVLPAQTQRDPLTPVVEEVVLSDGRGFRIVGVWHGANSAMPTQIAQELACLTDNLPAIAEHNLRISGGLPDTVQTAGDFTIFEHVAKQGLSASELEKKVAHLLDLQRNDPESFVEYLVSLATDDQVDDNVARVFGFAALENRDLAAALLLGMPTEGADLSFSLEIAKSLAAEFGMTLGEVVQRQDEFFELLRGRAPLAALGMGGLPAGQLIAYKLENEIQLTPHELRSLYFAALACNLHPGTDDALVLVVGTAHVAEVMHWIDNSSAMPTWLVDLAQAHAQTLSTADGQPFEGDKALLEHWPISYSAVYEKLHPSLVAEE